MIKSMGDGQTSCARAENFRMIEMYDEKIVYVCVLFGCTLITTHEYAHRFIHFAPGVIYLCKPYRHHCNITLNSELVW